jgi:hypothetical protein
MILLWHLATADFDASDFSGFPVTLVDPASV